MQNVEGTTCNNIDYSNSVRIFQSSLLCFQTNCITQITSTKVQQQLKTKLPLHFQKLKLHLSKKSKSELEEDWIPC